MKLSFLIPAYNEEAYLGPCLKSVIAQAQKYPGEIEILVVNNASTDKTKEVALSYPGVRVVDETRKGLLFARQAGFLASSGELLANIDADTVLSEGWLDRVLREFASDSKLVALSGPYIYYDMPLLTRVMTKIWYGFGYLLHLINHYIFHTGAMLQGGNFIVRRTALEQIGGFNLAIKFYGEDTDLARRIQTVGRVKFTFGLPMYTSGRRLRGEGLLTMAWRYGANHLSILYSGKPVTDDYRDIREDKS